MAIAETSYGYDYNTFMTSTSQVIIRNPMHTASVSYTNTFGEHLREQLETLNRVKRLKRMKEVVVLKRPRAER